MSIKDDSERRAELEREFMWLLDQIPPSRMKEISAVMNGFLQAFQGIFWEFGELENPIVRNLKLVEYIEGMKIDPELKEGSIDFVEPILGSSNLSGRTILFLFYDCTHPGSTQRNNPHRIL